MNIPKTFLDEEVRCGFMVPTQIKQFWAAELEVLSEIDRMEVLANYNELKEKIYIWGCGKYGALQVDSLLNSGYMVEGFIDNDSGKVGKSILYGIYCLSPNLLSINDNSICIISVNSSEVEKIYEQAVKMGFVSIYKSDFDALNEYAYQMEDKKYLEILWRIKNGYDIDWENPITFNEKLQWLKLYDRKNEYTKMVDKYEAKKYVSRVIGEQYIIPTLGLWNNADEIDYNTLPNQFVLKCTHDSGGIVICKDKEKLDKEWARNKLNTNLKIDFYKEFREWPYKNVKHRIIAESYLVDDEYKELRDYKLYTFSGKVKCMLLVTNRQSEKMTFDYFDVKGKHLELVNYWHPNASNTPHLPHKYDEMIYLAELLSKDIPEVRVDFYEVNGNVYFGELTFFDMGGFLKISPDKWDAEWGALIELPKVIVED